MMKTTMFCLKVFFVFLTSFCFVQQSFSLVTYRVHSYKILKSPLYTPLYSNLKSPLNLNTFVLPNKSSHFLSAKKSINSIENSIRNLKVNSTEKSTRKPILLTSTQVRSVSINSFDSWEFALENIARILNIETDKDILKMIVDFKELPPAEKLTVEEVKNLFTSQNLNILEWDRLLDDFMSLANALFVDMPDEKKSAQQENFRNSYEILENLKFSINTYIQKIHPGFYYLRTVNLQKKFHGQGIRIAVFDTFEPQKLTLQRKLYPYATIGEPILFGSPVKMSHGNSVIDMILQLAPAAEIIPVSSDAKSYAKATDFMASQSTIDIVNMSRAFAQGRQPGSLDPAFRAALEKLIQAKILCKSLGNTGTDFNMQPNPRREHLGLGPAHDLAAYDLALLKDFFATPLPLPLRNNNGINGDNDFLLFAENLSLFADDVALSATIPGDEINIQKRTIGLPAEGVWSPSAETFESGSSFAAPQLAALSALLLEAVRNQKPFLSKQDAAKEVVLALKSGAELFDHSGHDWGAGLVNGDKALSYVESF